MMDSLNRTLLSSKGNELFIPTAWIILKKIMLWRKTDHIYGINTLWFKLYKILRPTNLCWKKEKVNLWSSGKVRRDSQGHEVALWVMDRLIIMIRVLVPWVYTYWNTYEIVHIEYVQLLHDNYISIKHLKKLSHIKIWSLIHFRKLEDLATLYWLYSLSLSHALAVKMAGYVTNATSLEYEIYLLSAPIFLPMQQWLWHE